MMPIVEIAAVASLFWLGALWMSQASGYPLFRAVRADDFRAYHRAYQRTLPLAVYAPFGLAIVSGLAVLSVDRSGPAWLLNAANAVQVVVTVAFAVPRHLALAKDGKSEPMIARLLGWNAVRVGAATVAAAASVALVVR